MNIYSVMAMDGVYLTIIVNTWVTYDGQEWVVRRREKRSRKVIVLYRGDNEEKAFGFAVDAEDKLSI